MLLVLVADMAFLIISVALTTLLSTFLSPFGLTCCLVGFSVTYIFFSPFFGLGSSIKAFLLNTTIWQIGSRECCGNNLAFYSDLSAYGLLTQRICYVFDAYTWIYFMSRLYTTKIPFLLLKILDLCFFFLEILMLTALLKTLRCQIFYFSPFQAISRIISPCLWTFVSRQLCK